MNEIQGGNGGQGTGVCHLGQLCLSLYITSWEKGELRL